MSDTGSASASPARTLYRERQWVPLYWWFLAAFLVVLTSMQLYHNRTIMWLIVPLIVLSALAVWILFSLDARAYLCIRGWIPTGIRVAVADPQDPTPYWLVSTRRPEELLTAFLPEQTDTSLAHLDR